MVAHELAVTVQDPYGGMWRHQQTCPFLTSFEIQDCERQMCHAQPARQLVQAFDLDQHSIAVDSHHVSLC
jgi:hypothetical protein